MKNMYKNNRGFTVGQLLIIIGLIGVLVAGLLLFDVETVKGNQMGVKETWSDGVLAEPLAPKTYFLVPGFSQKIYAYDMGVQVYVMNDKDNGTEYGEGRKSDSYLVQSKDQQDMKISLRVQWVRLPEHLVALHKNARDQVEERVLRPVLLRVVKDEATLKTALDAYSGQGLVDLQKSILTQLQSSDELNRYIKVTDFVIEHIGLNKEYTDQIVARQVAVQAKLRADEETKQKLAEAEKAKAAAQSNYEQTLVEARRDKEKGILDSERLAKQQVLAAEADAKKVGLNAEAEKLRNVLIAEGEKEAAINRAQAILALGKADAESKKLQLSAYAVEGADSFVKIEVAKSMATAFQNIKGYLPEKMSVNLLTEQYSKGVNLLVGAPSTTTP